MAAIHMTCFLSPTTFEAVKTTAARIRQVQDFLEIPIAVENVSSYAEFHQSEMTGVGVSKRGRGSSGLWNSARRQ